MNTPDTEHVLCACGHEYRFHVRDQAGDARCFLTCRCVRYDGPTLLDPPEPALDLDEIERRGIADRDAAARAYMVRIGAKSSSQYTCFLRGWDHARSDVPALVAEVRRLRAENERLDALWAETTNDAICETNRANGAEEENERLREAVARVESTCGFVAEMAAVADVAGPPAMIVVAMAKDILALLHGEPPRAAADAGEMTP